MDGVGESTTMTTTTTINTHCCTPYLSRCTRVTTRVTWRAPSCMSAVYLPTQVLWRHFQAPYANRSHRHRHHLHFHFHLHLHHHHHHQMIGLGRWHLRQPARI